MFLVVSILLIVLTGAFCAIAGSMKLRVRDRMLQIRTVIVTVIFGIAAVLLFAPLLTWINNLISNPIVRNLMFSVMPGNNVSAAFYWFITMICCLILSLLYLLVVFLVHTLWVKPLSRKGNYLKSKFFMTRLFHGIAGLFYDVSEDSVSLPPMMENVGVWFRAISRIFAVLVLVISLAVSVYLQVDATVIGVDAMSVLVKSLYMLPVLSYGILDQVSLFFAADRRKKGDLLTETEEIDSSVEGDYGELSRYFLDSFENEALIATYKGSKKPIQQELFSGVQEELRKSVQSPELLDSLHRCIQRVTAPSTQHLNGLVTLINGDSVAAFDTPWGEFDVYYLAYVQHRLTLKETVLVICDTRLQVKQMSERFATIFKRINIADKIWRIRDMETMEDGKTDVLICTEEEFLDNPICEKFPRFDKAMKIVVMLNGYGLLCREGAFSSRIFEYFHGRKVQFVFYIPENNTDIRNELQERIGSHVGLCENSHSNPNSTVMFWRGDSCYKSQLAISERLYHDFGVAYTLAIIAAYQGVPEVHILAPENVPTKTYFDLVTREYAKILAEDYFKSDAINLATIIHNNSYGAAEQANLSFSIIYDENNNLLNATKTWLAYGGSSSALLHIVSAPYMLRDYLACTMDEEVLQADKDGLQLLVPRNALSLRSPAMTLLLRMRRGVTCEEVLTFAQSYEIDDKGRENVVQILRTLLEVVFGKGHGYEIYTCFNFAECKVPRFDGTYHYTVTISLINDRLYQQLCNLTESFTRLEGAFTDVIPVDKDDVYNYYLPKQQVTFRHVRYTVESIHNGVMRLKPEETVHLECQNTPVWHLEHFEKVRALNGRTVSTEKLSTEFFEAKVTRAITSYYKHPGLLNMCDTDNTTLVELDPVIRETKTVPCLKLRVKCPVAERGQLVANTLCFLLKGAMETFLPKNHKDLLIFSAVDKKELRKNVSFKVSNGLLEDPIPADLVDGFDVERKLNPAIMDLIPDVPDSVEGNADGNIHIYIAQFSQMDAGLLTAIAADLPRILRTLQEYLAWSERQNKQMPSYLRLGYESTPGIFDTSTTARCLELLVGRAKQPRKIKTDSKSRGPVCSFCGRPAGVAHVKMRDGRVMCRECHSHAADTKAEIKELLVQSIELLEQKYGISIPPTRVKFKGADKIRKALGDMEGGRVLGFYDLGKREIWIERGGPKPCVMSTLVHELTHAWQHANVDMSKIELMYVEGHTSYVEVECLREKKQAVYAKWLEDNLRSRTDEYGEGFKAWEGYLRDKSDRNIFHHFLEKFGEG